MKTETILTQIHPRDLWFPLRSKIEGRRVIVHDRIETDEDFALTKLTFEPPLILDGYRMKDNMFIHCATTERADVFGSLAEYFRP